MATMENVAFTNMLNINHWLKIPKIKLTLEMLSNHILMPESLNVALSTENIKIVLHFVLADRTMTSVTHGYFFDQSIGG